MSDIVNQDEIVVPVEAVADVHRYGMGRTTGPAIVWAEPFTGCITARCACGQNIKITQKAIREVAMQALAEFAQDFTKARARFRKQAARKRQLKAAETPNAKELATLKRELRKLSGMKAWGK